MFFRGYRFGLTISAGLGALLTWSVVQAQSNFLVPLPQMGNVIALNNSGQVLYDTGLWTGNTFTAFPAGFTPIGREFAGGGRPPPGILGDNGAVAGTTAAGHLAVYSAGIITDFGLPSWSQAVTPIAINTSNQIVGISPGDFSTYSFIYSGGVFKSINVVQLTDIPPPPSPTAINDGGQVVLSGFSSTSPCRGFLITGEALTDLGPVCPNAINASGEITGTTTDASGQIWHAVVWSNGTLTVLPEPPPFTSSSGAWINRGGQIVGSMSAPVTGGGWSYAQFFYNGVMTDINSLVSASDPLKSSVTVGSVYAINDNRVMLVLSTVPVVGSSSAYLLQAPWLDVTPGPLTFTNQPVGTASAPQTLTLANSGAGPLSLDSISLASGAQDFAQTNACPRSLAAGANCAVSVTFTPSAAELKNAVLNVVTAGATIAVPLSGMTPLTITMSASPNNPTVRKAFTITWTATLASGCQSSGGTEGDGWTATTTAGSVAVVEAAPGAYTYKLTCSAGGVSTAQSLSVTVAEPGSGGTGALDFGSLLVLVGLRALRYRNKSAWLGRI
jgi:hypothetical protein